MGKRKVIEQVSGGYIIEEIDPSNPFAEPKRTVAKDSAELRKHLNLKDDRGKLLPFEELDIDLG